MSDGPFAQYGVYCRKCHSFRVLVTQSRHAREGIIRRRRCENCGHTFRTIERHFSEKNGSVCNDYPAVAVRSTWQGRKRNGERGSVRAEAPQP